MTLENLTFQQIVRFANSADLDVAQFGHRAVKLMKLAVKSSVSDDEIIWMRNCDEVLRKNLANTAFVSHLLDEFHGPIVVITELRED